MDRHVEVMHPLIANAYLKVHQEWLATREDAQGYSKIDSRKISERLDRSDMKHIAAQFNVLFPAHYFKVIYALNSAVNRPVLLEWLQDNPCITLIDLGCGAGAASAAFIATILNLIEEGYLDKTIKVVCIGVDLVQNVLGIYYQLLDRIQKSLPNRIDLEIKLVHAPVAESVTDLDSHLNDILTTLNYPSLAHVLLMQVNIVRPLSKLHSETQSDKALLSDLGIPPNTFLNDEPFGHRELRSYHQLFTQVPIDHLHIFTIGTEETELKLRVQEMGQAIGQIFSDHEVTLIEHEDPTIYFKNPEGSYWFGKRNHEIAECHFCLNVTTATNLQWQRDTNWHNVIRLENLKLAWVRVRAILLGDGFYDETEIRLFEYNLDANLQKLQNELKVYANDVARTEDRLQYLFPKKVDVGRPKILSRMEEDILSVAIIQVLGYSTLAIQSNSYAFRPNQQSSQMTEYLYEYWFEAYSRFTREAKACVEHLNGCSILRVDIESYFTNIQQKSLIESVTRELRSQSERITWLLRKLLLVDLDTQTHATEYGLSQGGAGSGFYANAYLMPVDIRFGVNNAWEVKLFRFVDDIIIVIPDPHEVEEVKSALESELAQLGLALNQAKEERYSKEEYLALSDEDNSLSKLSETFENLTNCLWLMNEDYRLNCMQQNEWWDFIQSHVSCLHGIGLFIDAGRLSRKIRQYLSQRKRERDLNRDKVEQLDWPSLQTRSTTNTNWATEFMILNSNWMQRKSDLRKQIVEMISYSYDTLLVSDSPREQRLMSTRIYFCANRLSRLGFEGVEEIICQILFNKPWIIRQPQYVVRGLAVQGYKDSLVKLFNDYIHSSSPSKSYFISLILHAFRFIPNLSLSDIQTVTTVSLNTEFSIMERLMATETWLQIGCDSIEENKVAIIKLLQTETSIRLRKNYFLLLAKCFPNEANVFTISRQDNLLYSAHQLSLDGNIDLLFSSVEPDVIRESYYSGDYPDDWREFNELGY